MRINIDINKKLLEKALKAGNSKTKNQVVEKALELYIKIQNQKKILDLWGKVKFFED